MQIPVQNKFHSLLNYPPLPYKNVVIGSSSKPQDLYLTKHTEHIFLTNYKTPPTLAIWPLIEKSFWDSDYLTDYVKTREFYNSHRFKFLLSLPIPKINIIPILSYFENVLLKGFLVLMIEKILLMIRKDPFVD